MKNTKNASRIKKRFNKQESAGETKLKPASSHDDNSVFIQSPPYQQHLFCIYGLIAIKAHVTAYIYTAVCDLQLKIPHHNGLRGERRHPLSV